LHQRDAHVQLSRSTTTYTLQPTHIAIDMQPSPTNQQLETIHIIYEFDTTDARQYSNYNGAQLHSLRYPDH
jgi:hypothetical protein